MKGRRALGPGLAGLKVLPELVQEVRRVITLGWADRSGFQAKCVVLAKRTQR